MLFEPTEHVILHETFSFHCHMLSVVLACKSSRCEPVAREFKKQKLVCSQQYCPKGSISNILEEFGALEEKYVPPIHTKPHALPHHDADPDQKKN
jgi:hypothetical protein